MSEPGLVKREILPCDREGYVLVRETWDLTAPGCPMIALRPNFPSGLPDWRPLEIDTSVVSVERSVVVPKEAAAAIETD